MPGCCAALFHLTSLFLLSVSLRPMFAGSAGTLYNRYPGWMFQTCPLTLLSGVGSLGRCVARCSQTDGCVAGDYGPDTGRCCLSDVYMYDDGVDLSQRSGSVYFQRQNDGSSPASWQWAFRDVSSNSNSVFDAWTNTGTYDDVPGSMAPEECWSSVTSASCGGHVRSRLLDLWNDGIVNPQQVKYSFYTNGAEVAHVAFNGEGSNMTTWFEPSRIISSSYSDLPPDVSYNFFSVRGSDDAFSKRHFYISSGHGGCTHDRGWMSVMEMAHCPYENAGVAPLFLYSTTGGATVWHDSGFGLAEVMAVFVKNP